MTEEEKMLWMFKEVHGKDAGHCHAEIYENEEYPYESVGVNLIKHDNVCWSKTKIDILFDYLTRHLDT